MKKLLSLSLSLLLLAASAPKALVIGLFFFQQEVVAEQYCVNIAKPQLDCSGRCYLNTQLQKKQASPTEKSLPDLSEVHEPLQLYQQTTTPDFFNQLTNLPRPRYDVSGFSSRLLSGSVWRPPIS